MLDSDRLLSRFGSYSHDGNTAGAFFNTRFISVYCMSCTKILKLFDRKLSELASLFHSFHYVFVGDFIVIASFISARGPGVSKTEPGKNENPRREQITNQRKNMFDKIPPSSQVRNLSV